jgi:hypothetical protein
MERIGTLAELEEGATSSAISCWTLGLDGSGALVAPSVYDNVSVASAGSVNQAPVLSDDYAYSWPANLPQVFVLTVAQLVQGFTDPDADPLGVANLKATGATVTPVLVGGQVTAYQFSASGAGAAKVTLSYDVVDGQGGLVSVAQSVTYNAAPVLTAPIADQSLVAGQVLDMPSVASSFTDADPLTYLAWQVGQDGQLQALPSC